MKYYKNLSIDESDFSVQRQGCRIHLTTTEYQLFITLLDHSGCICSRNFLLASAWNITVPIQTRTVDVHIAKLRQSTAVAAVIAFGTVLPHLWQVLRDYGLPSLLGPAMSISDLQAVPKFITLSDLLLFWLICRFAACLCMSRITLWLGQKLGNLLPALFISAVSYCLPALLSLSGMKNGIEWLGFYPLFHAAALWQNQGYAADGESYNAMWIPIFLVCAAFFLAWAIGQALIDDYDMIGVPDEVL